MKFEAPEIKKVSFETENIAANEQIGGGVTVTPTGSGDVI